MDSILTSIKKLLGIEQEYTQFDIDIIMHINSVFSILTQIGIGPKEGFTIEDKTSIWSDFDSNNTYTSFVKSYVFMKVRMMFDPPTSSALIKSMEDMISEMEWRMLIASSNTM